MLESQWQACLLPRCAAIGGCAQRLCSPLPAAVDEGGHLLGDAGCEGRPEALGHLSTGAAIGQSRERSAVLLR